MSGRFLIEEEGEYDGTVSGTEELRSSSEVQLFDPVEEIETVGDDVDDSITPSQLVKEITIAWQNEICSPRLLPHM